MLVHLHLRLIGRMFFSGLTKEDEKRRIEAHMETLHH
jgi:hypothetical protein